MQDLVEVVMSLKFAIEHIAGGSEIDLSSGPAATKLTDYANLLASQGALRAALAYLGKSEEPSIATLRERLTGALGSAHVRQQQTAARTQRSQGIHNCYLIYLFIM